MFLWLLDSLLGCRQVWEKGEHTWMEKDWILRLMVSACSSNSVCRHGGGGCHSMCCDSTSVSSSPFFKLSSAHDEIRAGLYVGRLVAGFGVGAASMLTPLYVSENAPRAIRGGLTGLYQLFIATGKCRLYSKKSVEADLGGTMLSFWINYGTLSNLSGDSVWLGMNEPIAPAFPVLVLERSADIH